MPGVDHQGCHGRGEDSGPAGEQLYPHELHGTGIDEGAHGNGPQQPVAVLLQNNAEARPQEEVAGHYRDGTEEGRFDGVLVHFVASSGFCRICSYYILRSWECQCIKIQVIWKNCKSCPVAKPVKAWYDEKHKSKDGLDFFHK